MAYENLLKSVEESAEEREREIRKKAETEAAGIRADARKEADEIQERAIRDAERSATIERNKQLFLVKGEIKQEALRSREKLFLAAFAGAEKRLSQIRQDSKYPVIFERLAREAAGAMGDAPFQVHVDKRDEELCRSTLGKLGIRCEILADIECMGGLVASSRDGLVTISNTVESRLERIREHRRREIHAVLTGG